MHWECTYGAQRIKEAEEGVLKGKIDVVAQNVKTTDFGDPVFKPYVIKEMNGVPVAIIGQAFPVQHHRQSALFRTGVVIWNTGRKSASHHRRSAQEGRASRGAAVA